MALIWRFNPFILELCPSHRSQTQNDPSGANVVKLFFLPGYLHRQCLPRNYQRQRLHLPWPSCPIGNKQDWFYLSCFVSKSSTASFAVKQYFYWQVCWQNLQRHCATIMPTLLALASFGSATQYLWHVAKARKVGVILAL